MKSSKAKDDSKSTGLQLGEVLQKLAESGPFADKGTDSSESDESKEFKRLVQNPAELKDLLGAMTLVKKIGGKSGDEHVALRLHFMLNEILRAVEKHMLLSKSLFDQGRIRRIDNIIDHWCSLRIDKLLEKVARRFKQKKGTMEETVLPALVKLRRDLAMTDALKRGDIAYSGVNRPPIPEISGQRFQSYPATDSRVIRPPVPMDFGHLFRSYAARFRVFPEPWPECPEGWPDSPES